MPWADTLSSGMYQKGGGFVMIEDWAGGVGTGWIVGVYHLRSLLESGCYLCACTGWILCHHGDLFGFYRDTLQESILDKKPS